MITISHSGWISYEKKIKIKWFLLIAVWIGCLAFCYININVIHNIRDARERKEILKKDTTFWRENTSNINKVIEKENLLTHGIESIKLGTVFLDDIFNRLGVENSLTELKVEMDTNQSTVDRLPVRLVRKITIKLDSEQAGILPFFLLMTHQIKEA